MAHIKRGRNSKQQREMRVSVRRAMYCLKGRRGGGKKKMAIEGDSFAQCQWFAWQSGGSGLLCGEV